METIVSSLEQRRLTLFVGAGASYASGFPTWAGLLQNLSDALVPDREKGAFAQLATYNSPLISARFLKTRLRAPDIFPSFVQDALYVPGVDYELPNPTVNFITALVELAHHLRVPIDIITYNFDDLLEAKIAASSPHIHVESVRNAEQYHRDSCPLRILHVHGFLGRDPEQAPILPPPRLVLSEDDFHRLMNDHGAWENDAQATAFAHRDCLFVGMSMTDPNLRRVIDFSERQRASGGGSLKWIITREYGAGDSLVTEAPAMSAEIATGLNNIKVDIFRSLGAEPLYVSDFSDFDNLARLIREKF